MILLLAEQNAGGQPVVWQRLLTRGGKQALQLWAAVVAWVLSTLPK